MTSEIESPNSLADVFHVTRDQEYLRLAAIEADFWAKPQPFPLDVDRPDFLEAYINEQLVGDRRTPWWETIPRYGTFRRGCSLGLGAFKRESRILELCPSLHLTIYDISPGALARREEELSARFPGRVTTATADLNFIELAPSSYDLLVSESCIHHVLNLEHVAFQADRALTPDGCFFLEDYVGESRFQFSDAKKRAFEDALQQMRARHRALRYWRPAWPAAECWDEHSTFERFSPFEAIRSDETLAVFRRYLTEVSVRTVGRLVGLLGWLQPTDDPPPASRLSLPRRFLRFGARLAHRHAGAPTPSQDLRELIRRVGPDLIAIDRTVAESGRLVPNKAFAVYQKRRGAGAAS